MNLYPTFGFQGTILPVVDKTDKFYLVIENDSEHRILLNIVSVDVNKFVNIKPKSSKIIRTGNYKPTLELKAFYLGNELFNFNCEDIKKEDLMVYSNYILKKELGRDEVSFYLNFTDGLKLTAVSDKPQNLYIIITDIDKNQILVEDSFISNEPYTVLNDKFVNYNITVFDETGQKIYDYNLDLKNKKVWIKLESLSVGESIDWVPYVDEFRKKHQCETLCTTHWNNLFISEYPNINFIPSDGVVDSTDLFAIYKIRHSETNTDLQKIASEALGLEYKEIKLNNVLEHMKEISTNNTI
jgi:hypothetical protein